jgi:hypothetical protein
MKHVSLRFTVGSALLACAALAQTSSSGPNKVVKTAKTGGEGGFDYIYADVDGRKLYIPRTGQQNARVDVFNLDTLVPAGSIPNTNARGVATDAKSSHGFASRPSPMARATSTWISKTKTTSPWWTPGR